MPPRATPARARARAARPRSQPRARRPPRTRAAHDERGVLAGLDTRTVDRGERRLQARRIGRPHADGVAGGAADELLTLVSAISLAAAHDDQPLGHDAHLAHQVATRQRTVRPSAASERKQVADPAHALGVEAVRRFRRESASWGRRVSAGRHAGGRWPMPSEKARPPACAQPPAGRPGRSPRRPGCGGSRASGRARRRCVAAERPVWIERASRIAPTSCRGARCSR